MARKKKISRLGVIANSKRPDAPAVLETLAGAAESENIELFTCGSTQEMLPSATHLPPTNLSTKSMC